MGCGPITAASKISDAREQLQKAEELEAPKYAPFEYQGAFLYLEKAREEEGYSYYQDAVALARKAFALALESQRKAQETKLELQREAAAERAEEEDRERGDRR